MNLEVRAPDGAPAITEGDDLAAILVRLLGGQPLLDGDVVVVTSKVVAKTEGRTRSGDRESAIADETLRVVARRGPTTIVRTRQGLTLAAAGVDASNVEPGRVVLLPADPDNSARTLRRQLHDLTGAVVGVVITDTAGRAWREGQTDIAIGAAGLRVLESFAGRTDAYGNPLLMTAPAVADEIAGAAELAQGKLGGRPFAIVRGRADLVLPLEDDGPGALALVRPDATDMFGYGAREAVLRALRGGQRDVFGFGSAASAEELAGSLTELLGVAPSAMADSEMLIEIGDDRTAWMATVAAYAHGWEVSSHKDSAFQLRVSPSFT